MKPERQPDASGEKSRLKGIPQTIWALGFVSMFMVPALMVLMNVVYSLTAYPVGRLSDRIGRTGMMAVGLVVLIASDLIFAAANGGWAVAAGTALWGLHMGLTQGLLSAMIADNARQDLRGTAFGIFSLASGWPAFSPVLSPAGCGKASEHQPLS